MPRTPPEEDESRVEAVVAICRRVWLLHLHRRVVVRRSGHGGRRARRPNRLVERRRSLVPCDRLHLHTQDTRLLAQLKAPRQSGWDLFRNSENASLSARHGACALTRPKPIAYAHSRLWLQQAARSARNAAPGLSPGSDAAMHARARAKAICATARPRLRGNRRSAAVPALRRRAHRAKSLSIALST
eukprot:6196058-Pleurochrysis_carterae.AAC.3